MELSLQPSKPQSAPAAASAQGGRGRAVQGAPKLRFGHCACRIPLRPSDPARLEGGQMPSTPSPQAQALHPGDPKAFHRAECRSSPAGCCSTVKLDSLEALGWWTSPKHPLQVARRMVILSVSLRLSRRGFTSSAREKIEAAGGSCELICLINLIDKEPQPPPSPETAGMKLLETGVGLRNLRRLPPITVCAGGFDYCAPSSPRLTTMLVSGA